MNQLPLLIVPRLGILLVAMASGIQAQTSFYEDQRFVPSDGSVTNFGQSVALEGKTVLVGSRDRAFVFRKGSDDMWVEQQGLSATGADACSFGSLVHLDQGRPAVADLDYPGPFCDRIGVLYMYDDDGQSLTLNSKIYGTNSYYGFTVDVDMDRDWMLVGADGYSPDLADNFPVAVFLQQVAGQWQKVHTVSGSDTVKYDSFGGSVAIDAVAGTAVIGEDNTESVYVFSYDGSLWTEVQKLTASDGVPGDSFGASVAIEGGTIVVGAPYDDGQVVNQGSLYVFRFDGSSWVETQNLASSTPTLNAWFGTAIDLDDGRLAVGAPGDEAAFVYRDFGTAFLFTQQLRLSPPAGYNAFGTALELDGPRCLVGAIAFGTPPNMLGGAFFYELHDLALTTNSAQAQAGQTLTIVTRGGIPGTPCLVTWGLNRQPGSGLSGPLFGAPGAAPGIFNLEGRCVLNLQLPAGLAGRTLALRTHGMVPPGVADESNTLIVAVQ